MEKIIKQYVKLQNGDIHRRFYRPIKTQDDCKHYINEIDNISKLEKKMKEIGVCSFTLFFSEQYETHNK